MDWSVEVVDLLAARGVCGYYPDAPTATEPTALTALALQGHDRRQEAVAALEWLVSHQSDDGSLGVTERQSQPCWPTSLALLAWTAADTKRYEANVHRALGWILQTRSNAFPRPKEVGHDTSLTAWPWVAETHGWVEPTALHVLALKAVGLGGHARTREAVRMLQDRLLPDGGCNCGNTFSLGGVQRPHLLPSALTLLALVGETGDGRVARTLDYVARQTPTSGGTPSLCFGLMALSALDHAVARRDELLQVAAERTIRRNGSPFRLALIALAALGSANPLITLPNTKLAS